MWFLDSFVRAETEVRGGFDAAFHRVDGIDRVGAFCSRGGVGVDYEALLALIALSSTSLDRISIRNAMV